MARWRMHLAAAVVLLLVLGISALGGTSSTRVAATDTAASNTGVPGDTGITADGVSDQVPDAAAGVTGAPTPINVGRPGSPAVAPRAGAVAGRKIAYDIGASDTEVKMGGSTFTSGPAATYGEQIAVGFAAGVNYVNDHGGINGRRLTVKIYDDAADPAKQLANIKRLVEVDHVFALSMAYAPIAGDYVNKIGIPLFLEGQFNEDFTNPWYYSTGGPQMTTAMAFAWYGAKQLGVKSVSVFYLDAGANNYSKAYADKVASYWKAYGVEVKSLVPFAPDQTSCSAGITAASGDAVDFIDFEIDAGHVIQCMVEAQIQGYKPPKGWGGYLIGVPVMHEALGDYSIGLYAFDAFGDEYKSKEYIEAVHKVSNKTETYSSVTMGFFVSAVLAADGMRLLGDDFTRVHLRDILDTFDHWRPPLTQSNNQPYWTWSKQCHAAIHGGYLIQIHKQPDGSLRWDQITPQGSGVPLPPGQSPPAEFTRCPGMFVDGASAKPF